MTKQERTADQHRATPSKMKNSKEYVMEYSSADSRLSRRIKAGKANANKLKRNSPYTSIK